ncbi:MAG: hypothetical protein J0L78_11715 [Planctomycetes bacterium]|nr:hypothetical protein [Planctomycetota bacterium]
MEVWAASGSSSPTASKLFRVCFKKPIDKQEIAAFNLLTTSVKKEDDLEKIFLLTKEGFTKSALADYCEKRDAISRYMFAALITNSDAVKSAIRREVSLCGGASPTSSSTKTPASSAKTSSNAKPSKAPKPTPPPNESPATPNAASSKNAKQTSPHLSRHPLRHRFAGLRDDTSPVWQRGRTGPSAARAAATWAANAATPIRSGSKAAGFVPLPHHAAGIKEGNCWRALAAVRVNRRWLGTASSMK